MSQILLYLLALQKKILETLVILKEQNCQILELLKKDKLQKLPVSCLPDLPLNIPIKRLDDIKILEEHISAKESCNALVL